MYVIGVEGTGYPIRYSDTISVQSCVPLFCQDMLVIGSTQILPDDDPLSVRQHHANRFRSSDDTAGIFATLS